MDWIVRFLMCMPRGDEARRGVERKRGRDPCCLLCAVKKTENVSVQDLGEERNGRPATAP